MEDSTEAIEVSLSAGMDSDPVPCDGHQYHNERDARLARGVCQSLERRKLVATNLVVLNDPPPGGQNPFRVLVRRVSKDRERMEHAEGRHLGLAPATLSEEAFGFS